MENMQFVREDALEELAARTVQAASCFAHSFSEHLSDGQRESATSFEATLTRLRRGEAFSERDDACMERMGAALVGAINELSPGYGDHVRQNSTHEDVIFDPCVSELRWLLEDWKLLSNLRDAVRARLTARRLIAGE